VLLPLGLVAPVRHSTRLAEAAPCRHRGCHTAVPHPGISVRLRSGPDQVADRYVPASDEPYAQRT